MSGKGKSKRGVVSLIVALFLILILAGGSFALMALSIVSPLSILVPSLITGFLLAYFLRNIATRISNTDNLIINLLISGILLSSCTSFTLLSANFFITDNKVHKENATIEKTYSKTFHRSRRVGRRYVTNGEPYKVYYIEVSFTDGTTKEIQLGEKGYGKLKKGDVLEFEIDKGCLGIPVIKSRLSNLVNQKRTF